MVLNDEKTIEPQCRQWWSLVVGVAALALVTAVATVRLDAGNADEELKSKSEVAAETNKKKDMA